MSALSRRSWTWRRALLGLVLSAALAAGVLPARADPASLIQTLMVVDQGHFISFQWSFYFVDFPKRFALENDPSTIIALDDPGTLEENLTKLVANAFDLRIDGKTVNPERMSRLTISPNKVCTVMLIYRGRPGAQVELRAPVLQYLPPASIINYEILLLNQTRNVITGNLTGWKGPFAQVVEYRETGDGQAPAPAFESAPFALFKLGLRTAWLNANWLFLGLVLILVLKPSRAIGTLVMVAVGWMAICLLHRAGVIQLTWRIPDLVAGLAVALLAFAAAGFSRRIFPVPLACGTGFVNAFYDLHQLSWAPGDQTFPAALAFGTGFACGLFTVALVLLPVVTECKKFSEFDRAWVPKICWLIAALALLLPLKKALFG